MNFNFLQIFIKDKNNFTNYVCNASNTIGTLETRFNLQEGVQPQTPQYITLRGANSDLLVIGVHVAENKEEREGMEPIGFRIEYRPFVEKSAWSFNDFEMSEGIVY